MEQILLKPLKKCREFIKGMIKERDAMKGEMNRKVIYGNEEFIDRVTKEYNVDAIVKLKGRPRKEENGEK